MSMSLWRRLCLRVAGVNEKEYKAIVVYMAMADIDVRDKLRRSRTQSLGVLHADALAVVNGTMPLPAGERGEVLAAWLASASVIFVEPSGIRMACEASEARERLEDRAWLERIRIRVGVGDTVYPPPHRPPPPPDPEVEEFFESDPAAGGEWSGDALDGIDWSAVIGGGEPPEEDDLIEKAREIFARNGRGSTELLRRELGIGYGRAARIVQSLVDEGSLGDDRGSNRGREWIAEGG